MVDDAQAQGASPGVRWLELVGLAALPPRAKHVAPWVEHHCRGERKHFWPGYPLLASKSGHCEAAVSAAVHDLVAVGFLYAERPGAWWDGQAPTVVLHLCWPATEPRRPEREPAKEERLKVKRERQARYREKVQAERDATSSRHVEGGGDATSSRHVEGGGDATSDEEARP